MEELKEIALESLLKVIGYMVIIEEKDYAKQLSNIYMLNYLMKNNPKELL